MLVRYYIRFVYASYYLQRESLFGCQRNIAAGVDKIQRRDPTDRDVQIEILFCGICHSDLHSVRNEWSEFMATNYPIVPGHEIVGRVTKVGSAVTKYKPGDLVAVGCMVDSDRTCPKCKADLEQFCPNMVLTFNSPDKHLGGVTSGGYSESIVVDEHFVLRVPPNLNPAGAAPLLCAGITTFSPMRHWGVGKGKKVGVVGLGGLGHMAVKFAHAFGAHVAVFTTSPNKKDDASGSAPMRLSFRAMPMRCKRTPAPSILSSTQSRLITTSTLISTYSVLTAILRWSVLPRSRSMCQRLA